MTVLRDHRFFRRLFGTSLTGARTPSDTSAGPSVRPSRTDKGFRVPPGSFVRVAVLRKQSLTPEELADRKGIDPRTHEFWALMRLHDLTEEEEGPAENDRKPKRQEKAAVRSLFRRRDRSAQDR